MADTGLSANEYDSVMNIAYDKIRMDSSLNEVIIHRFSKGKFIAISVKREEIIAYKKRNSNLAL